MHKWFTGKVPQLHTNALTEIDNELIKNIKESAVSVQNFIEEFKFRDALFEVIDLARKGNKYLQEKEPWKKVPALTSKGITDVDFDDKADVENTIHLCLQLCANLAVLINPFLPNTAKKMLHIMKVIDKILDWENAGKLKLLSVGYSLREPQLLFRKIEDGEVSLQVDKLKSGLVKIQGTNNNEQEGKNIVKMEDSKPVTSNQKPEIQYDDFAKLELKAGTITACVKVEKADKLLKLEVDLGSEKRTIVSGIAQHYTPEEMVGKQVIVVTNLAPRKMKGIESQGMILTAEDNDGKLQLLKPENPVRPGSNVS
jgi:methionyl-tRNA synthetase